MRLRRGAAPVIVVVVGVAGVVGLASVVVLLVAGLVVRAVRDRRAY